MELYVHIENKVSNHNKLIEFCSILKQLLLNIEHIRINVISEIITS